MPSESASHAESSVERATAWAIVALLVLTPLFVLPDAKESFRLGQGLLAGWLGLLSLAIASWSLRSAAGPASPFWFVLRRPAIRALAPLAIVVAAGGLFTSHPAHFRAACADFLIGVACVVGWSLALREQSLRRVLFWTIPPAVVVALLGLDQFAGWFGTLDFLHVEAPTARLRLTSTVGNPGDLAAMLVLPVLVALDRWKASPPRARVGLGVAIVIMLSTIAVTATLAAGIAVVVGASVWWWVSSSHRPGRLRLLLLIILAVVAIGAGTVTIVSPLRVRFVEKTAELANGDINALLTGRLDGWRVAWAMLWQKPMTGVGQGAFRAEFADTRLALENKGVTFYAEQQQSVLATPHNEGLSVAAEQGLPGVAALAWGIGVLCVVAWRRPAAAGGREGSGPQRGAREGSGQALAWGGIAALGTLCVASFPLHVPAIAWPWLLFMAWLFSRTEGAS